MEAFELIAVRATKPHFPPDKLVRIRRIRVLRVGPQPTKGRQTDAGDAIVGVFVSALALDLRRSQRIEFQLLYEVSYLPFGDEDRSTLPCRLRLRVVLRLIVVDRDDLNVTKGIFRVLILK